MDPISFFPGFILVLDSSAHILYASQNITKQIGPTLADTIGEPFGNLIHEDDSKKLEELGTLLIGNQQKQHMFAVRMKTNMSPTIRSQSKRTYKKVLISAHFKCVNESCDPKDMVVLMFCRNEDFVGIPEIYIGAHLRVRLDALTFTFLKGDQKAVWVIGWSEDQVLGKNPALFGHPNDGPIAEKHLKEFQECIMAGETTAWPPPHNGKAALTRVLTSWGQWLWHKCILTPNFSKSGKLKYLTMDMYVYGADEGPISQAPLEDSCQDDQPKQAHTMKDVMQMAKQVLEQTNLEKTNYSELYPSPAASECSPQPWPSDSSEQTLSKQPPSMSPGSMHTSFGVIDSPPYHETFLDTPPPCMKNEVLHYENFEVPHRMNPQHQHSMNPQHQYSMNPQHQQFPHEPVYSSGTGWTLTWNPHYPTGLPSQVSSPPISAHHYHPNNDKVTDPIQEMLANL